MAQLTLRTDGELVEQLKAAAASQGQSLNRWATSVLRAAVDPELAGDEAARMVERFRRAGLLVEQPTFEPTVRPSPEELARAGAAAAQGKPLSDFVIEGRG